ncbi:DUF4365 domain-containing protein [Paenibacillus sp. S150]|uniref:DUF4365 domain-containing protein n=1 Tax=Paenibacillus sp. S150 TaxID=2749826 RepID=UPI001C57307F|nr:DUF4365 domain-containing protein [Paenibacillus sp. S150]MBW4079998.1 DUF4365 domain-containing protein [Paenibacillus sp. S150]
MDENLPQRLDTFDQENRSILKLQLIVPQEKYLVRTESGGDYGVDLVLELKNNCKYMTNFRTHLQLKSNSTKTVDKDGTFEFSVPIKTINYLLNQPQSIFIIYVERDDIFLWEWVNYIDETTQQNGIDIITTTDKTFTYKFHKTLTHKSFDEIYDYVKAYGQYTRELSKHTINGYADFGFNSSVLGLIQSFQEEYSKAASYEQAGKYKKALRIYDRIASYVKTEEIYFKCAVVAEIANEFNKAIRFCDKILKINNNHYEAQIIIGTCYGRKGQYPKAIELLRKAMDRNKSDTAILLNNLAFSYWKNCDLENAIVNYERLLLLPYEKKAVIHVNLALCYREQFQIRKAYGHINSAITLDPNNSNALAVKGGFERFFGKSNSAEELFRSSLRLDSNNYQALLGITLSLIENNKIDYASLYFGQWIKKYKDSLFSEIVTDQNIMIIEINWKSTLPVLMQRKSIDTYSFTLASGIERHIILPKNDFVGVGFYGQSTSFGVIPKTAYLFKEYEAESDATNTINEIKKHINLIKMSGKECYSDVDSSIEVDIEVYNDHIFFVIDFNGYGINGMTNPSNEMIGYKGFIKSFNRTGSIQISLSDKNKNSVINIMDVSKVTIKRFV